MLNEQPKRNNNSSEKKEEPPAKEKSENRSSIEFTYRHTHTHTKLVYTWNPPQPLLGDKSDGSSLLGSQSTPSGQRARFAFFSTLLFFQLLSRGDFRSWKPAQAYTCGACVCVAAIITKCELLFSFSSRPPPLASHLFGCDSRWLSAQSAPCVNRVRVH